MHAFCYATTPLLQKSAAKLIPQQKRAVRRPMKLPGRGDTHTHAHAWLHARARTRPTDDRTHSYRSLPHRTPFMASQRAEATAMAWIDRSQMWGTVAWRLIRLQGLCFGRRPNTVPSILRVSEFGALRYENVRKLITRGGQKSIQLLRYKHFHEYRYEFISFHDEATSMISL